MPRIPFPPLVIPLTQTIFVFALLISSPAKLSIIFFNPRFTPDTSAAPQNTIGIVLQLDLMQTRIMHAEEGLLPFRLICVALEHIPLAAPFCNRAWSGYLTSLK